METTTNIGLNVWDLTDDQFSHTLLQANWEKLDLILSVMTDTTNLGPNRIQILSALPGSGNFSGRLVMLSNASGGFGAWTLVRYLGGNWYPVGGLEILGAVPGSGNFGGRVVLLSSASGGFTQWSLIRYDGAAWVVVGGTDWSHIDNGSASNKIKGAQTAGDVFINDSARGLVLTDRADGSKRRVYLDGSSLHSEVVS